MFISRVEEGTIIPFGISYTITPAWWRVMLTIPLPFIMFKDFYSFEEDRTYYNCLVYRKLRFYFRYRKDITPHYIFDIELHEFMLNVSETLAIT